MRVIQDKVLRSGEGFEAEAMVNGCWSCRGVGGSGVDGVWRVGLLLSIS